MILKDYMPRKRAYKKTVLKEDIFKKPPGYLRGKIPGG